MDITINYLPAILIYSFILSTLPIPLLSLLLPLIPPLFGFPSSSNLSNSSSLLLYVPFSSLSSSLFALPLPSFSLLLLLLFPLPLSPFHFPYSPLPYFLFPPFHFPYSPLPYFPFPPFRFAYSPLFLSFPLLICPPP